MQLTVAWITAVVGSLTASLAGSQLPATTVTRVDSQIVAAGIPLHRGIGRLVTDIVVGIADGPAEYVLGAYPRVAPVADGAFLVADGIGSTIKVRLFDSLGKFVGTYGRSGDGPGEYRIISGLGMDSRGRVLVFDGGTRSMNVYDRQGALVALWGKGDFQSTTGGLMVGPDGVLYLGESRGSPIATERSWIRVTDAGRIIDTVHALRPTVETSILTAKAQDGTVLSSLPVPFSALWHVAFSPYGYFVSARSDKYELIFHRKSTPQQSDSPGRLIVRKSVAPSASTGAERAEWRDSITSWMSRMQPGWRWTGPDVPNIRPALLGLQIAVDGRVWVWVTEPGISSGPSSQIEGEKLWDVFEADGRYVGAVRTKAGFSPWTFRGDVGWVVHTSAEGVPQVVRTRIVWP